MLLAAQGIKNSHTAMISSEEVEEIKDLFIEILEVRSLVDVHIDELLKVL